MSGCVIRCERPKKMYGAEKKIGGRIFLGGVEKVIWPPNTITRRPRKKIKNEVFPVGRRKIRLKGKKLGLVA